MFSLRSALAAIGEPAHLPLAIPSSFGRRMPASLRQAMDGMTDPAIGQWHKVGVALSSENTQLSEEAQGAATDGARWYVSSNKLKGVVAFDDAGNRAGTFRPTDALIQTMWEDAGSPAPPPGLSQITPKWLAAMAGGTWAPHFGAPGVFDGWVHVPVQGPRGVWRFRVDGTDQKWKIAAVLPTDANFASDDLFPWCAVHPVTGLLYTCNYGTPDRLMAYHRETLQRQPAGDFRIGPAPIFIDRIQGGVFTAHGRLILVRSDYNAVFCFSSLNGHCFGAKALGDFGSDGSEVESVAVRSWQFDGTRAEVHILELDNDLPSGDDFDLHSFQVPDPGKL